MGHYNNARQSMAADRTGRKNASMIRLLKKVGFKQCGVAYYEGFGDMITFDYLRPER